MNPQPKQQRWKSKKWRDAAQGQPCTLNLSCCNGNPETTVLAHANGAGWAMKASDHNACDACSECHAALDGERGSFLRVAAISKFKDARLRTIINRLERGILK
jgi:hypothetical protein